MISEQDEGQSTSNDNETENREDSEQNWLPRRHLCAQRDTETLPEESESSPTEPSEVIATTSGTNITFIPKNAFLFIANSLSLYPM